MKRLVILPTLIKSMFYQSNWNISNMQGTGFIWLIKDFFRHNKTKLPEDFDIDSVYYFNTNPYMVTFILGMLLKEARVNGKIGSYDKIYASALAALGDTFFWHSLRPFVFFVSLTVILINPVLVIVLYVVIFNIFNIMFRVLGFYYGYNFGANVITFFNRIKFNKWSAIFDGLTVFLVGIILSTLIKYDVLKKAYEIFYERFFLIFLKIKFYIYGFYDEIYEFSNMSPVLSVIILVGIILLFLSSIFLLVLYFVKRYFSRSNRVSFVFIKYLSGPVMLLIFATLVGLLFLLGARG